MALRWRLTLWHVGMLAIVLIGFALVSYRFLADGLAAEIDRALQERAQHVLDAVQMVPNRNVQDVVAPTDEFNSPGIYVQVLTPDGEIVAHSYNLGQQQLPIPDLLLEQAAAGESFYVSETVRGQQVRLYYQPVFREERIAGIVQVGRSLQGVETTLGRLQTIYTVGIAGALLIGGAITWLLVRLGLQPVTEMAHTASRIAQSGNLNERLAYDGPRDEIGRLATTFNTMMDRVEDAFAVQRSFVADTAHELRTPIATIRGNVDLLLRYGDNPDRRQKALASIKKEGERTTRLINDLLLLAQADAGQQLELVPVELDAVMIDVYEKTHRLAADVHVSLEQCEPVVIRGDRDRLVQMLLNLVTNALTYTEPPGHVSLSLTTDDKCAIVQVRDTGVGIPPDDMPHIFERFYTARRNNTRGTSSIGLGLAIVKWIVEEHDGTINVESHVGEGSTFTIRFPVRSKEHVEPRASCI